MSDSTTAIVPTNSDDDFVAAAIEDIRNGKALAYSSITAEDMGSRLAILEAVTDSQPISENLNKPIAIRDIIIQKIPMADQVSGEITDQPRIVFISEDGTAYHAISQGLLRSVNNLIGIAGEPGTWPADNLPVATFKRVGPNGRQYFTAAFGAATKKK
jgi:hypothetical protein